MDMIRYARTIDGLNQAMLTGFFVGWPNPPTPEKHLRLLAQSDAVEMAVDTTTQHVAGFITALTDDLLSAHITFLEVLPQYQGRGIGSALVQRLIDRFDHLYALSVQCDAALQPFYARFGMKPVPGMGIWRYPRQAGT